MTRTVIADGIIRLTGENGILDTRDGKVYSEYVGSDKKEKFFTDAPDPAPAPTKKMAKAGTKK